jgi:KDO2-lipid IV(A) lauroyltransferase
VSRARLIRAGTALLRGVPPAAARRIALAAGDVAWRTLGRRRAIVEDNLVALAPDRSAEERRRLARETFRNLSLCSLDLLRLPLLTAPELLALFDLRGLDELDAALAEGRGAIILTPHLGTYDLGGAWLAARGYTVAAVVEDLAPEDHEAMSRLRAATGMRLISADREPREVLRVLARNEVLLIVADRVVGDARSADAGVPVRFGTRDRRLPPGPAKLALRTGAPVFIGHIALDHSSGHNGGRHYAGALERLVVPAPSDTRAAAAHLTQCIAAAFADVVRRYPDQWFVFQPDWSAAGV